MLGVLGVLKGWFKRGPSEREVVLAAIQALQAQSVEQQRTFQNWLQMFQMANGQRPQGWIADDDSVAIKELAREQGLKVPEALLSASEKERVEWLAQQMDSDEDW